MHTISQVKAAPAAQPPIAKPAAQPLMSPTVDAVEAPSLTEQMDRARLGHHFGAISVFPPDPPIQPKRMVESVQRLSAFSRPGQSRANPVPVIPAGWAVPPRVQAKLTVGEPNDPYEQEADRVADQVLRMAEPRVQAKCACGGEAGPDGECAACKTQRLGIQRQAQAETAQREEVVQAQSDSAPSEAAPGLEQRLNGSRGSGHALPADTRRSMESTFGADFGGVRVHTGNEAVQMNKELSAQAFTHGSDIYFNAGKYEPGSQEGKGLLAHELTHVVQQGSAELSSEVVQRSCGSAAIGEPAGCEALVGALNGPRYLFKVNCDEFARGNDLDLEKDAEKIGDNATVEIHGLASVDGSPEYNQRLSCARAITAKKLVETVLSKRKVTATIRLFSHGPQKGDKTGMRSVVMIVQNPAPVPVPRKAIDCPPIKGFQASTLEDYIDLIKCVETSTTLGNREVLALLRQMYYGKSWSATSQTDLWDNVIPCNVNPGDPRKLLHADLFEALHKSVNVQGTDTGHVFTGLESMMCPTSEVKINSFPIVSDIMDDIANVKMSNEQFATWGGDLGAAVAAMAACWFMNEAQRSSTEDCKGADLMQGLLAFLKIHAPDEDLEGDILPFVIRANANGISCSGSVGQKLNLSAPISQMFVNFINSKGASGNANRYVCFTEIIGGQMTGGQIQNKDDLVKTYFDPVLEFAKTFYVKIMTDVHGKIPPHRVVPFGDRILMMERHIPSAIRYFLAWLEKRMTSVP